MADTTYLDFIDGVKAYYGSGSDQWAEIAKYGLKADNALNILKQVPDVEIIKNADGTVRGITYKDFTSWGGYPSNVGGALNSNTIGGSASASKSFNMNIPSNTKVNETTKTLEMTSEIGKKVSTGKKVIGTLANIGQAVFAVATACTLGKTIDKALYNLNPDFWNAHDMETLNPDTWASITNSGSVGDNIFNALMGVDPDTNETTAYVDENALAYMALYLQEKGIFESSDYYELDNTDNIPYTEIKNRVNKFVLPVSMPIINYGECSYLKPQDKKQFTAFKSDKAVPTALFKRDKASSFWVMGYSDNAFKWGKTGSEHHIPSESFSATANTETYTYNGKTVHLYDEETPMIFNNGTSLSINTFQYNGIKENSGNIQKEDMRALAWALLYYSTLHSDGLAGVSSQDNATIPDLSGANSVEDALNILKNTLPSIFNNAITNSVPQPDGSIKDYTYIPITLPNTNNANNPQPETGGQNQAKPQVNPDTSPDTLLHLITELLGTKPNTPNPPDTGKGNTPNVIIPTGSANALYKIYNPSQTELNSFGAWLWSSNFVDQLLKVFNNPMESIIGLHKIYASPVIGGTSNIKVGYLDSGVNSNFVSNQYTKIDCGTVNLQEYFGNVFDYAPYTNIELYLPCIGFVKLDVGNVMRSSINITYTVDVLTGACIAEINVKRDNSGGVLYSYSGNCASQYPLSSGSYMGIVSSVIGVAGSVVGTVASGGSLAPLALGATSGLLNAKTHVQHSGSLSGNSGVMGGKIPYLIITRPQTNMAENYQHLQGIPSNTYTQLSACRGFVKVKNVNVQNIIAESEELEEIKTLLLDGVII